MLVAAASAQVERSFSSSANAIDASSLKPNNRGCLTRSDTLSVADMTSCHSDFEASVRTSLSMGFGISSPQHAGILLYGVMLQKQKSARLGDQPGGMSASVPNKITGRVSRIRQYACFNLHKSWLGRRKSSNDPGWSSLPVTETVSLEQLCSTGADSCASIVNQTTYPVVQRCARGPPQGLQDRDIRNHLFRFASAWRQGFLPRLIEAAHRDRRCQTPRCPNAISAGCVKTTMWLLFPSCSVANDAIHDVER